MIHFAAAGAGEVPKCNGCHPEQAHMPSAALTEQSVRPDKTSAGASALRFHAAAASSGRSKRGTVPPLTRAKKHICSRMELEQSTRHCEKASLNILAGLPQKGQALRLIR